MIFAVIYGALSNLQSVLLLPLLRLMLQRREQSSSPRNESEFVYLTLLSVQPVLLLVSGVATR